MRPVSLRNDLLCVPKSLAPPPLAGATLTSYFTKPNIFFLSFERTGGNPTRRESALFLKCAATLCCPLAFKVKLIPQTQTENVWERNNLSIAMETSLSSSGGEIIT